MFKDSRIETNIVGETSVIKLLAGQNIYPVGGTGGDGIANTHDFIKDIDVHVIKLLTVKIEGDIPEQITFNIILGSKAPPILGSQYTSPETKLFTTSTVTNKEYIKNIHVNHGHIQTHSKRTRSAKPHCTLPKAMDFNDIISVDLKELQPEYRKNDFKYIVYIIDEFSKFMKGILIKDKEAETVVMAVYRHWIVGINGVGYSVPTQHL